MLQTKTKATIRDVAAAAGVAPSTVSKVLSGRNAEAISNPVKARVRQVANKLNYTPNFGAQIINRMSTKTVGILLAESQLCEEHIRDLILALTTRLNRDGYSQYVAPLRRGSALRDVETLIGRGCEAFLLLGTPYSYQRIREMIEGHGRSYIAYGSQYPRNVEHDTTGGIIRLLQYFLQKGERDFRILMPRQSHSRLRRNTRFRALRQVLPRLHDRELLARHVQFFDDPGHLRDCREFYARYFRIGFEATEKLFTANADKPGAILYFQDIIALGGVRWLHDHGIQVGKDVLVAGVNNIPAAEFGTIPFSSAGLDLPAVAGTLVDNMFGTEDLQIRVPPKVYLR